MLVATPACRANPMDLKFGPCHLTGMFDCLVLSMNTLFDLFSGQYVIDEELAMVIDKYQDSTVSE